MKQIFKTTHELSKLVYETYYDEKNDLSHAGIAGASGISGTHVMDGYMDLLRTLSFLNAVKKDMELHKSKLYDIDTKKIIGLILELTKQAYNTTFPDGKKPLSHNYGVFFEISKSINNDDGYLDLCEAYIHLLYIKEHRENTVVNKLFALKQLYNLSVDLWYQMADDNMKSCGHCGVSGINGTSQYINDGYAELLGAIGNLTAIKEKMWRDRGNNKII